MSHLGEERWGRAGGVDVGELLGRPADVLMGGEDTAALGVAATYVWRSINKYTMGSKKSLGERVWSCEGMHTGNIGESRSLALRGNESSLAGPSEGV